MRLAADRRARVPFALVAVALLVGSLAISGAFADRGPIREDRTVGTAMDRTAASATSALRTAVDGAARDAARNPVTRPADTPAGGVVNDSAPFRDALRIRIYVAARERLRTVAHDRRGVTATAALGPTPNASALRAAKRSVEVEPAANGTALRVTIEGIELTARRGGRAVARETETVTLTVATPVLAMHDRTVRFDERLDRGTLDGPGLGRQLTARLYPVAWARGYGQYAGAPIESVVANRHVELATNEGLLRSQRAAFGRHDPATERGVARAGVGTLVADSLAPTPMDGEAWSSRVLVDPNAPASTTDPEHLRDDPVQAGGIADPAPGPEATTTVGVNRSADAAFLRLFGGESSRASSIAQKAYEAAIRYRTTVERVRTERRSVRSPPGENWTLVGTDGDTETVVSATDGPTPAAGAGERAFDRYARRVTERRTVRWTWRDGDRRRTTSAERVRVYRVGIALVGRHEPPGVAPDRPIRPSFERGGTLSGPNLADVRAAAIGDLEAEGRDAVARAAAEGSLDEEWRRVEGRRPAALDRWIYADVVELRETVRNVSVAVPRSDLAAGAANPPAELAAELEARRAALVDAPATYDGAADRARVAVRAAYVDAVVADLRERAARTAETTAGVETALRNAGLDGSEEAARVLRTRERARDPACGTAVGAGGPGGAVEFEPRAEPAYLSRTAVEERHSVAVRADGEYHPLAARNVNYFALPTDDAAGELVDRLPGFDDEPDGAVPLRTAGRVLATADRALAATEDDRLGDRRDRLRGEVEESLRSVDREALTVLEAGTELSGRERRAAVAAARGRWNGTGRRAVAAADGGLADAVADEAAARMADPSAEEVDRLRTRLRVAVARAVDREGRVSQPGVNRTASRAQDLAREAAEDAVASGTENAAERVRERWIGDALVAVPAGLPVTPVPGYWYATVNVWSVEVRGTYARFSVRARTGPPTDPGASVRYVRDGSTVSLDVTGDGTAERLGRNERVSFETGTTIVVAVPAGPRGVGDVDGTRDERSAGWPRPGCVGIEDDRDGMDCLDSGG